MEFANYMTFSAPVPPAIKYRPALKAYRRVLELEPAHAEAQKNKTQIEEIYKAMDARFHKTKCGVPTFALDTALRA
jgi:hypothetical protein